MKAKFWLEEKSPKQIFEAFVKTEKSNATFWEIMGNYNPKYYKDKDPDRDNFSYPLETLTSSNTFYGFNNDAGTLNLSYDEEEHIVSEKFEHYKTEISALLNQKPDSALQPKLDYKKLNTNQELEENYWELIETNPFMYEFEGHFTAWKNEKNVLFLSVMKEDKELPYEIQLGGLDLDKFTEILEKFNSITGS